MVCPAFGGARRGRYCRLSQSENNIQRRSRGNNANGFAAVSGCTASICWARLLVSSARLSCFLWRLLAHNLERGNTGFTSLESGESFAGVKHCRTRWHREEEMEGEFLSQGGIGTARLFLGCDSVIAACAEERRVARAQQRELHACVAWAFALKLKSVQHGIRLVSCIPLPSSWF